MFSPIKLAAYKWTDRDSNPDLSHASILPTIPSAHRWTVRDSNPELLHAKEVFSRLKLTAHRGSGRSCTYIALRVFLYTTAVIRVDLDRWRVLHPHRRRECCLLHHTAERQRREQQPSYRPAGFSRQGASITPRCQGAPREN